MIRSGQKLDRVAARAARGLLAWTARREDDPWPDEPWPELWNVAVGAVLLGALAWVAFSTRVPDVEKLPPETLFAFLGLYFYSVGFLSGRRTGQVGSGGWAGAVSGLAFAVAVCGAMYQTALREGVREAVQGGPLDQVAIALSGLVFFIVMGALCGALGARRPARDRRRHG